jgi:hypothetical protein
MYYDELNRNIATQFVAEHLLTMRVFRQVFSVAALPCAADIEEKLFCSRKVTSTTATVHRSRVDPCGV